MNDIFISYDSADRPIAQEFADALESRGWSVWWDREIPLGKPFDQVIEEQLNAARCVIVLWSKESVRSRWVKTEAAAAADRERLLPVLIDDIAIPFEFKRIQTAMLANWHGDVADPEFNRLIRAVGDMVGQTPAAPPGAPSRFEEKSKPAAQRSNLGLMLGVAAVLIAITGAIAVKKFLQKVPPPTQPGANTTGDPSSGNSQPAGSSPPVQPPIGTAKAVTVPAGAFTIKIGDKITDGVPGPGAGSIETPYSQDVYVFTAAPKQRVYFRMLRHSNAMASIKWKLTDSDGTTVFDTCLGCTEAGVQTLLKGGTYTLTLGNDRDPATGTYQLQLFNVPEPSRFSIKAGDQIKDNFPAAGAGVIESPGAEDIYSFTATPRQKIYFRIWEYSTGMGSIRLKLVDDNGMEVFNTCLGCSEPGVQTLVNGGTYTLTVGHDKDPATGTYRLQLYNVPPANQFSIKVGDKIRPGAPGAGAGTIESPGAQDIYVFNAAPGQKVYFHPLERDKGMDYIKWRLVDDNGMELFNTCLGCSEPGVQTLTRGGTYTLTVGHPSHPATGTYAFEIGSR